MRNPNTPPQRRDLLRRVRHTMKASITPRIGRHRFRNWIRAIIGELDAGKTAKVPVVVGLGLIGVLGPHGDCDDFAETVVQDGEGDGERFGGEVRRDGREDVGPGERQNTNRWRGVEFLVCVSI